jgi:hypothetical protein
MIQPGTWEGISELEVRELEVGVELLRVPYGADIYMDVPSNFGLQFVEPQPLIYDKDTKFDFKNFQYLVRSTP